MLLPSERYLRNQKVEFLGFLGRERAFDIKCDWLLDANAMSANAVNPSVVTIRLTSSGIWHVHCLRK
jgi:hypothetical protein